VCSTVKSSCGPPQSKTGGQIWTSHLNGTINGRVLGHGEPIRVKQGERVLFHILNGSATEIRSLALPGHSFEVVALDGNPVPNPTSVPVLWLGTAERISAIVHMSHPGVWILGDLADDDRRHGMGIVVEYAGRTGKAQWIAPPAFNWNYARFAKPGATAPPPDETFQMTFAKDNAAEDGSTGGPSMASRTR
jgi:FtsP/CotA-like multicopper oxidase with cupredoxin domain